VGVWGRLVGATAWVPRALIGCPVGMIGGVVGVVLVFITLDDI
jgi:hypothetical protein